MKKNREPIDKLEERLVQAYHDQQSPVMPSRWRWDVMRDIRQLQAERQRRDPNPAPNVVFRRMVLPFASAAAAAAIILTIYSFTAVPGFEQDLFALLTEDTSGMLSTQITGM